MRICGVEHGFVTTSRFQGPFSRLSGPFNCVMTSISPTPADLRLYLQYATLALPWFMIVVDLYIMCISLIVFVYEEGVEVKGEEDMYI